MIVAVVLAGGASRRFGSDKLAAVVEGQTLLDQTLSTLPAEIAVVLVGPARQTIRPVEVVREEPAGSGPAAALVAGLRYAIARSAEAVLVLPGDAPRAGAGALVLLERLNREPATEAVVAVDDSGQIQPLQLALRPQAAETLVRLAGPQQAANVSARALVSQLDPPATRCALPADFLFDVDTPEALRHLQS